MSFDKELIGQKFKKYRKLAKLSQEQLAEKVDLAEKHYGRLERGLSLPALDTFFKITKVLNIPLSEFGFYIIETENNLRNQLLKTIFSSDDNELEAYLDIIKSIKKLRGKI